MRSFKGLVAWGLLASLAILAPATPAWSHASLVKSSPANGASLSKAPSEIRAWFSEGLAVKGSTLRLYDSRQKLVASGGIDPAVAKHDVMRIAAPHLANGAYVVKWHAISADDNEPRDGSFKFSIGMGAQMTKAPMADLPPLQLIAPANGARVKNPVALVVETPGDIDHLTMGNSRAGQQTHQGGALSLPVRHRAAFDRDAYDQGLLGGQQNTRSGRSRPHSEVCGYRVNSAR